MSTQLNKLKPIIPAPSSSKEWSKNMSYCIFLGKKCEHIFVYLSD